MSKPTDYQVWKDTEVAQIFLNGVRGAIPLAQEQIEILLRLIKLTQPQVRRYLDLGCGNGILGQTISQFYQESQGVFLDCSESMLEVAKQSKSEHFTFILEDFSNPSWLNSVSQYAPFDVIVSGFSIHHQEDTRKKQLYQEIYGLLANGGIFLNLEHVDSHSSLGKRGFDQLFVDSLYSYHQSQGSTETREELDLKYYNREDKTANLLTLVEKQCQWLREIGFTDVDCYFKVFEIALFGGLRS